MLPPVVTKSLEHLTSTVIGFAAIVVVGALVAMILARSFGGNSKINRQAIFSIVGFFSLCVAAYYAFTRFSGGG
jgi:hypothetical protein